MMFKCVNCCKIFEMNEINSFTTMKWYPKLYHIDEKTMNKIKIAGLFICDSCIKNKDNDKDNVEFYADCFQCEKCKITTMIEDVKRKKKTHDTIKIIDKPYFDHNEKVIIFGTYCCLHCQNTH